MKVAVIKYPGGNVRSVVNALQRLGIDPVHTDDPGIIGSADKVIFPGVGEAGTTMQYLRRSGLGNLIVGLGQDVLGICLGMQLMCEHSEEGDVDCLGIFPVKVRRFPAGNGKVPHMGWNNLRQATGKLFAGLPSNSYVYFVHSYFAEQGRDTSAVCDYILPFSAGLEKDNFYATQFHPEKSGTVGELILKKFIGL